MRKMKADSRQLKSYIASINRVDLLAEMSMAVQEHSFSDRISYWDDICLDTTYHAIHSLDVIHELLGERRPFGMKVSRNFLVVFFDKSAGGFKHHKDASPTPYATDIAYRLIRSQIDGRFERFDKRANEYLLRHQDSSTGGFWDEFVGIPTISATLSSLFALWRIHRLKPFSVPHRDGLVRFLQECKKERSSYVGFVDNPSDNEPLICLTAFALTALQLLGELRRRVKPTDADGILRFTDYCWDESEGGYSWSNRKPPTLIHTRWALHCLRLLAEAKLVDPERIKYRPGKVLSYIERCESNGGFGYAEGKLATVYSTRCALLSLSDIKEIARLRGDESQNERVTEFVCRRRIGIEKFIDSCRVRSGGYMALGRDASVLCSAFPDLVRSHREFVRTRNGIRRVFEYIQSQPQTTPYFTPENREEVEPCMRIVYGKVLEQILHDSESTMSRKDLKERKSVLQRHQMRFQRASLERVAKALHTYLAQRRDEIPPHSIIDPFEEITRIYPLGRDTDIQQVVRAYLKAVVRTQYLIESRVLWSKYWTAKDYDLSHYMRDLAGIYNRLYSIA